MSEAPRIHVRDVPPRTAFALEQAGIHPLLARLFAARGVRSVDERLRAPLLGDDWSAWAEAWHALDAGPLRALAESGDAGARLTLAGERHARGFQPAQRPWWKRLMGGGRASVQATLEAL